MLPKGDGTHHYHFKGYALDTELEFSDGSSKKEVEAAMKNHILAQAEWVETYAR